MSPVERGDPGGFEALGYRYQAGVGATESQIGVCLDQFGDPSSVGGRERFDLELTCGYGAEETRFRGCTDLSTDQVGGLGDDEGRRYERPGTVDRVHAPVVIGVGVVGSREKDARVDDEQASVSAEAVGKKLIGFARKSAGAGRAESDERERWPHGHVFGR